MKDFTMTLATQKGLKIKERISILKSPRYLYFENINDFIENKNELRPPILSSGTGGQWFNNYFAFFEDVKLVELENKKNAPFYFNSNKKQFYNFTPVFNMVDNSGKLEVFWQDLKGSNITTLNESVFNQNFRFGETLDWLQLFYDVKYKQASIYDLHVQGAGFDVDRLLRKYSTYLVAKLVSIKS